MIRKESEIIKIKAVLTNSNLTGTNIGCTTTILNDIDFLDISIKEAFSIILEEINGVEDKKVKESLEIAHYYINKFYLDSNEEFLELFRLSACSLGKNPTSNQMQNIIKFWIISKYCNENIDIKLICKSFGKFEICERNIWFFSPSNSVTCSIEKSIAIITHFFKVTKFDSIKNGKCYISKITITKDFNCSDCENGFIELENEIIEDFVDGKKTVIKFKDKVLQSDFINIQIEKDIRLHCGNCVSDIERVPSNISMLTK